MIAYSSFFSTSCTDTFYLRASSESCKGTGQRVQFLYRQRRWRSRPEVYYSIANYN